MRALLLPIMVTISLDCLTLAYLAFRMKAHSCDCPDPDPMGSRENPNFSCYVRRSKRLASNIGISLFTKPLPPTRSSSTRRMLCRTVCTLHPGISEPKSYSSGLFFCGSIHPKPDARKSSTRRRSLCSSHESRTLELTWGGGRGFRAWVFWGFRI